MGFTSAAASIAGIPIIDADEVFSSGDPERFAATSIKQKHGTYSKGMFFERSKMNMEQAAKACNMGSDGTGLMDDVAINYDGLCRIPYNAFGANLTELPSGWLADINDVAGIAAYLKEQEEQKADLHSRLLQPFGDGSILTCLDQNGTNYCWANAPAHEYEINRFVNNLPFVRFSPASVAGPITGFRNQGGWGGTALVRMRDVGIAPASVYPVNLTRKPANYAEAMTYAAQFKAFDCYDCTGWQQCVSVLLRGFSVAVGLNWWRHEVTYIAVLIIDGVICILARNSWGMSYGDKGFFILRGSKMRPDDACVHLQSSVAA